MKNGGNKRSYIFVKLFTGTVNRDWVCNCLFPSIFMMRYPYFISLLNNKTKKLRLGEGIAPCPVIASDTLPYKVTHMSVSCDKTSVAKLKPIADVYSIF